LGLVCPHPRNQAIPVMMHLAADGLNRAYRYAGIERQVGGLWHPFRRRWATLRKHYPVRDVADAGGWTDTQTLLNLLHRSRHEHDAGGDGGARDTAESVAVADTIADTPSQNQKTR
jgi:hypothetical protein